MKFDKYIGEILNEMSSLSRLYDKTQRFTCGMVTAFRDGYTYKQNLERNRELLAYLLSNGYDVTQVKGAYIENFGKSSSEQKEVGENTFFVCNKNVDGDDGGELLKDLKKLGEHYEQDSILYVPFSEGKTKGFLVGTSKDPDVWPDYDKAESVGFPKYGRDEEVGQFFSRIRGRTIEFKEAVEMNFPKTRNGKWGMKILAERVDKELKELISEAKFDGGATGLTSKMWIMKTGKVFSTKKNWHYHWALNNKEMLSTKFNIDFSRIENPNSEDSVRIGLIKQGMFRLNHEERGNKVTIEGVKKYFNRRVKDTILGLVMDNSWDISFLSITLFDESVNRVLSRKSVNLVVPTAKMKVDRVSEMLSESVDDPKNS